jgi:hypothetical protein
VKEIEMVMMGVIAGAGLIQLVVVWRLVALARTLAQQEARLRQYGEALALLTDTSESGFQAVARELERLGAAPPRQARRSPVRRMAAAARKGRSVAEIAAAEEMSEGEVRLRLHLEGARKSAAAEHGSL